jgi:uncharacterized protein YjbI with pentapeptide repeats
VQFVETPVIRGRKAWFLHPMAQWSSWVHRALGAQLRRLWAILASITLVAAACGSGGDGRTSPSPTSTTTTATDATGDEPDSVATDDIVQSDGTESVEPQPELWDASEIGLVTVGGASADFWLVDDVIWLTRQRWDHTLVARSDDDGRTFTTVEVEPPPAPGAGYDRSTVEGIVGTGDTLVGWGTRWIGCTVTDLGEGQRIAESCRNERTVIHLSTDGGTTWRQLEPAAFAPAGDQNVRVFDMTYHDGRFVAGGGLRGAEWYGRIWVSPDGENWSVARDVRGENGSSTVTRVLSDGDDLLVRWNEHTCAFEGIPPTRTSAPTWGLGTDWPEDVRILVGPDTDSLVPVGSQDTPLLPGPRDVDCGANSPFELAQQPYPNVSVALVGGAFTIVDTSPLADDDLVETDDGELFAPLRWATRTEQGWTTSLIDEAPTSSARFTSRFDPFSENGRLALFDDVPGSGGPATVGPRYIVVDDAGTTASLVQLPKVPGGRQVDALRIGDVTLVALELRPVGNADGITYTTDPEILTVARYEPGARRATCELVAGGSCRSARLELVEGYPEFTGLDLAGLDLSYADLGAADLSETVLDGAILVGAEARRATFVNTSLQNADLSRADLSDVAGADLRGARLVATDLAMSGPVTLTGAELRETTITVRYRFEQEEVPVVLSLAGLDLRTSFFAGPFLDSPPLVISDLRDALVNDRTTFNRTDLSTAELDGIDITSVIIDDKTICPTGFESNGEFRGSCLPVE